MRMRISFKTDLSPYVTFISPQGVEVHILVGEHRVDGGVEEFYLPGLESVTVRGQITRVESTE